LFRSQADGLRRRVDPDDPRAGASKAHHLDTGATTDVDHVTAAPGVEVDEAQQVVELFEVVLVEVGEEAGRARLVGTDLEIVDVTVPVAADVGTCRASHRARSYQGPAPVPCRGVARSTRDVRSGAPPAPCPLRPRHCRRRRAWAVCGTRSGAARVEGRTRRTRRLRQRTLVQPSAYGARRP